MDRGGVVSAPGDLGPRRNVRLGGRMMIWDGEARSELRCCGGGGGWGGGGRDYCLK